MQHFKTPPAGPQGQAAKAKDTGLRYWEFVRMISGTLAHLHHEQQEEPAAAAPDDGDKMHLYNLVAEVSAALLRGYGAIKKVFFI